MTNFSKMYEFPDFVRVTLYGQIFTALVVPYVDRSFKQVRFNICAVDGTKTQKIRFHEKIEAFENALKESHPNEWAAFHKG